MQQLFDNTIDFQPNYLVPMTKLKTSELKNIWKDDLSFRKYVRKFWCISQKSFVETLAEHLIDEGAEIDYDFSGMVPGLDGVIYFKIEKSIPSIEGFINGMNKLQKEYGLFSMISDVSEKLFEKIDNDDFEPDFIKRLANRKPPQIVAFNELKKAWATFKKNKQSQLEPKLFDLVCEQLEKMEHLFVSFVCTSFDWISDDSHLIELLSDFVEQFKNTLYYDMMNKRFMEVVDISNRKI